MRGPKVVLAGAGSPYFGRQFILAMINGAVFDNGTMALVDTDEQRLDKMMRLAGLAINGCGCRVSLEGSTDCCDVLTAADFVILSFSDQGLLYRDIDAGLQQSMVC